MSRGPETADLMPIALPAGDLWVFGYGSLMWRPGFAYAERQAARLYGYHRALCVWSWVHRGSERRPGLVLGLDRGGSCIGRAFRVARAERHAVAAYLVAREMVTPVYRPMLHTVHLAGRTVAALSFTIDRANPQYAGKLDLETAAAVVRRARGIAGWNTEYLANTVAQLDQLGIADGFLHRLADRIVDRSSYTIGH